MTKNYLLQLLLLCSEESFGQNAVEWAIVTGRVQLTGNEDNDLRTIMGEPGKPDTGLYDQLCLEYRQECERNEALLAQSYSGLLEEINRPVPLHQAA